MNILGHEYKVISPTIIHSKDRKKARNRIHINDLKKADGTPIRFKSLERAENYIRNFNLAR